MTDLTLVELFAGIGGFSCGFERAGVRTVAAVEIDPIARRIYSENIPGVAMFDDVTKVGGDDIRATGFIPERGIITAGWPCQDISRAGREAGLSGERSGLFYDVVRLLRELQPRWFVLENVPRLLTINGGRDMGAVIGSLAECGYGIAWRVLDASGFGTPQRRRRVFFVGCLGDTGRTPSEILFDSESLRWTAAKNSKAWTGDTGVSRKSNEDGCWSSAQVATVQGGGQRGYRIDAEGVAGGHLIVAERI